MQLCRVLPILLLAACGPASAQSWPVKPVRVVMGFPAGTTVDVLMRPLAQRLTETLGQPWVLDNRPGATGMIANELVANPSILFMDEVTSGEWSVGAG